MKKLLTIGLLFLVLMLASCKEDEEIIELIDFNMIEGIDTIEINTQWIDSGIELSSDSFSFIVYSTDDVNTSILGLYEVNYTVEYNDVTYTETRYVMVTDQTPPQMELSSGLDTVIINTDWTDQGATVTDNSLEILSYTTTGTVDTSILGVYEIIYTAIDSSGNTTSLIRFVTVVD